MNYKRDKRKIKQINHTRKTANEVGELMKIPWMTYRLASKTLGISLTSAYRLYNETFLK